ncbi:restriction endonuclease [Butyrivibrio sp. XB500-5]|uniref:HIRAN domain-containing protein n=1 Tax=Butyrivibrio sp. XB500-5 TaxID=2364880 RepID=UPI000EA9A921|nr:HIRAN domain-containing protein [Butyrivibrio sp. XB500-5]RKM63010.1 restriction endonuclease [Butyrivibrio sp. XB500-5]
MANELTIGKENMVALVSEKGVGDLIKPLTKEIFLFDSYVAGTTHLKDDSVLDEINEGDKLVLQRENNRFDENAILVMTKEKKRLGYVPEKDNIVFSRLMDAGKMLTAQISRIEHKGTFRQVNIGIYLVDF